MANDKWFETLLWMEKDQREKIVMDSLNEYYRLIMDIAADIYDSCIKLYYVYKPKIYKRHGHPEGYNLFQANQFMYIEESGILRFYTDEYKLWTYRGGFDEDEYGEHYDDKRELVLDRVMKGIRGSKTRFIKDKKAWPKKWKASYPNKFSKYKKWNSSGETMYAIFDEFMDQYEEGSENMTKWFWEILELNVKQVR